MEPKNLVTALTVITLSGHMFEKHPMYPNCNPPIFVASRHEGQHSPHSEEEQQYPLRNAQGVAYVYGYINPYQENRFKDNLNDHVRFPTLGIF